jgi:hypothetical protein
MKRQIIALGVGLVFVCQAFAGEHAALARVTAYWLGKGSGANAAWNGTRLNEGTLCCRSKENSVWQQSCLS